MATRWTPTPTGVRAQTTGPSPAASLAAALLTMAGTTLALLIAAALLLPGPYGQDSAGLGAVDSPAPSADPVQRTPPPQASAAPLVVPSPAAGETAGPAATLGPTATPDPAAPGASPRPALAQMREPAPLTVDGREIGRVTVQAVREVRSSSADIPAGRRLMVASVRLDSVQARLPYDERSWLLEDENGDRYAPVADAAPKPLGSGTLAPDGGISGSVAFVMPAGVRVRAVVLTDGSGVDLLVFSRPSVSG